MKLLIFKAYFEPEIAASTHSTLNQLEDFAALGWRVDLHVPIPTRGVSKMVYNEYKRKKHEEYYGGKIIVRRFSMFRESEIPFLRAIRYLCTNVVYFYKGLFSKDIDAIYVGSTPPTIGLSAAMVKKLKRIPFIYSLQDVFPDSLVYAGLTKRGSVLWKIGQAIEKFTYKNADKIIVISEDFKRNLIRKGVPENKIDVIYNCIDANAIVPVSRNENILFDKLKLSRDKFYVVYAGNLGHAQNIEIILKVAQRLLDYKDIKLIIFGGGQQAKYYKNVAKHLRLDNTEFYPLQPYSMLSNVYSLGDISLVSCKEGLGKSAMPSKTWGIMSAATAVIANFDENTDLHHIINKNEAGLFTKSGDIAELKNAILKLYRNRTMCETMGRNGRKFVVNNLKREIGFKKLVNVIKNAGDKRYV